jgi:hypothetical protein
MTLRRALIVVGLALVVAGPASSANSIARVWIADEQPLVVRGAGFHTGTQVTVTVSKLKHTYRAGATTGSAGGFTARFGGASLSTRCGTTVVTATDATGQKAVSRIVANDCGIRVPPLGP